MNNDIIIQNDNCDFNYRVAIVIRKGHKILVQKDDRAEHYTLPGGRCELGESSASTAIRELKEETDLDSTFVKGVGLIENFFASSFTGRKIHELLIINELNFIDQSIYNKEIINNIEEKKDKKFHLTYIWLDIKELKAADFRPAIILDMLEKDDFQHYINKD